MIDIIVLLEVKDKDSFREFESRAINIMQKHGGRLISAFRPDKIESTLANIYEVHCLEFPDLESFHAYRSDPEHHELSELRSRAIAKTSILVSGEKVVYEQNRF